MIGGAFDPLSLSSTCDSGTQVAHPFCFSLIMSFRLPFSCPQASRWWKGHRKSHDYLTALVHITSAHSFRSSQNWLCNKCKSKETEQEERSPQKFPSDQICTTYWASTSFWGQEYFSSLLCADLHTFGSSHVSPRCDLMKKRGISQSEAEESMRFRAQT